MINRERDNDFENNNDGNGWPLWSKYVLKELERLNTNYEALAHDVQDMREDIVELKLKAGIWGMIGACIPVLLGLLLTYIKAH